MMFKNGEILNISQLKLSDIQINIIKNGDYWEC